MAAKVTRLQHLFAGIKAAAATADLSTDSAKANFIAERRTPCQRVAASDRSTRKAIRCPRRAGKSWYALSEAVEDCLRTPSAVWVIIGLTRPSVRKTFWGILKRLSREMELGLAFREVDLEAHFSNGSVLLFHGAETRAEGEKLRGSAYNGCIVDECKSFNYRVFKELVEDVIEPALGDRCGVLILVGTPGEVLAGPFYEATCEPPLEFKGADGVVRFSNRPYGSTLPGPHIWSLHTWGIQDNVELPHLWAQALERKRIRGWDDTHPTWRREYLGHWVATKEFTVYRYVKHKHDYSGALPDGRWNYVLGLDIGYRDGDAIVVLAYSREVYDVYQVYGEKRPKLNITELAAWVREVRETFDLECMVADYGGNGTKVLEELAATHRLHFRPAEKTFKNDFIELINTEFDASRIHILADSTTSVELLENRWLEKTVGTDHKREDPRTPNDLCDALLYAWRWCDHRRPTPPDRKPVEGSDAYWAQLRKAARDRAEAEHLARKGSKDSYGNLDRNWWAHPGKAGSHL